MKTNTYPEFTNYFGDTIKLDWAETNAKGPYQLPIDEDTRELVTVADDTTNPEIKHVVKLPADNLYNTYFNKLVSSNEDINTLASTLTSTLASTLFPIFINTLYPIGSVYLSMDSEFDPNVSFKGTHWEQISGAYLYAASKAQVATGVVSGNRDNKITISNLPAHTHGLYKTKGDMPNMVVLTPKAANAHCEPPIRPFDGQFTGLDYTTQTSTTTYALLAGDTDYLRTLGCPETVIDNVWAKSLEYEWHLPNETYTTGGAAPFMPAYYNVAVWKRIS